MGYEAEYQYNLTANQLEYAFYNQSIIYTHSHGLSNKHGIILDGNTELLNSHIDSNKMRNAELVYVSACAEGVEFCTALYAVGNAQCVVGFKENIHRKGNQAYSVRGLRITEVQR